LRDSVGSAPFNWQSVLKHLVSGGLRIHIMHANTAIRDVHFVLVVLAVQPL
jgi:hypothetical protein